MDDADITWRRAGAADVPAIRTLSRAAYAKWVELIGREPKPMTADYDAAVRAHRIDLLFSGGMLAGLVQTSREPDHLLIVSVAVLPACQGQGFGRRLLQHAEDLAAALGLPEVRLYTNARFAENLRLYAKRGYRVTREEAISVGVVVHMAKPVPAVG